MGRYDEYGLVNVEREVARYADPKRKDWYDGMKLGIVIYIIQSIGLTVMNAFTGGMEGLIISIIIFSAGVFVAILPLHMIWKWRFNKDVREWREYMEFQNSLVLPDHDQDGIIDRLGVDV